MEEWRLVSIPKPLVECTARSRRRPRTRTEGRVTQHLVVTSVCKLPISDCHNDIPGLKCRCVTHWPTNYNERFTQPSFYLSWSKMTPRQIIAVFYSIKPRKKVGQHLEGVCIRHYHHLLRYKTSLACNSWTVTTLKPLYHQLLF